VTKKGGTLAAINTRPNARQVENPNTRQLVQPIGVNGHKPDSPNARQAVDVHLKTTASNTHQTPSANTRQAINPDAAFNYEAQLLRLETYKDRYGRTICKRTVRFVRRRTGRNIGEVTPELAEALKQRPGKGRTTEARAEAERNRLLAESLAKRLRGTKAGRRKAAARKGRSGRPAGNLSDAFGGGLLSDVSNFSQHEGATYVH